MSNVYVKLSIDIIINNKEKALLQNSHKIIELLLINEK